MTQSLPTFIRVHRQEIVSRWIEQARLLPAAQGLARPVLQNHVPVLLDALADAMERGDTSATPLGAVPSEHAIQRFHEGFDLHEIVEEYRILRRVVLDVYAEKGEISAESRPRLTRLTVMNEALDRAIADAVDHHALQAAAEREKFIGILGHDLRDPLNAMIFAAETLARRAHDMDGQSSRLITHLTASSHRMAAMVRDMLDFARGRMGGGLRIVPSSLEAHQLVEHTVSELAVAHPHRDMRIVAPAAGDFQVEWDPERITQAIANLVNNAITHGSDPVTVHVRADGATVCITVANDGEIPHGHMPRLFEPFVSGARAQRQGLGLGLYIVKEIARAHGGTVQAESGDGRTSFTMILPRIGAAAGTDVRAH